MASRGRARPAKGWPPALWTRGGGSPPRRALSCPHEPIRTTHPDRSERTPAATVSDVSEGKPRLPPTQPLSPCPSPGIWTPAGESRQALSPRPRISAGSEASPGPGGPFDKKRSSPQSAGAGRFAAASPTRRTGPRLGSVRRKYQSTRKRGPTRRFRESLEHSMSASVCAGPGSTLAAAARADPALGTQGSRGRPAAARAEASTPARFPG